MAFLPVPIPAIPLLLIALGSLVTTLLICKLFTTETREDVRGGAGWGWIVIPPIFLIPQITFWLSLGPNKPTDRVIGLISSTVLYFLLRQRFFFDKIKTMDPVNGFRLNCRRANLRFNIWDTQFCQ
jgi:hypothetical protein